MCVWDQVVGHVLITFQRSPLKQIRKAQTTINIYSQQFAFKTTKGETKVPTWGMGHGASGMGTGTDMDMGIAEASQFLASRAF